MLEAALFLLLARTALIVIPFPYLARVLGTFVTPTDPRALAASAAGSQEHAAIAAEIGWAVTRAARHVPFKAVCLPQAMAAKAMLTRRGVHSSLHFGVARGNGKPINAHAWLDTDGIEVTGYPVAREFTEVACFV